MKNRITSFLPSLPFSSPLLTSLFPLLLTFLTLFAASIASAQIPSSGLVGYWPFNGNANDESGNGNNGTVNGATLTTDRFGNANSAYSFVGGATISVPHNASLGFAPTGDFSASFWFYTTSITFPQHFMGKRPNNTNIFNWQFLSGTNLNTPEYSFASGLAVNSYNGAIAYQNLDVGQWVQLIGVYSNGNWKLFKNGVQIDETQGVFASSDVSCNLLFGSSGNAQPFTGKLDDISIYNRALSPAEITQLYTDQTSLVEVPCTPFLGEDQTVCSGTSVTLEAGQSSYSIGQTGPAGGIVFHTQQNANGETQVFEAAPSDIGNVMWGCAGFFMNQTSAAIGSGQQNTNAIISACGNSTAAALCANYTLNGADDWYLPSINELTLMFQNLWANGMGNFNAPNGQYWSSTENSSAGSMIVSIDGALPPNYAVTEDNKSFTDYIRPCRSFTVANNTYLWSTGATTATINVTPTTTTTYTCTVTDANGNACTDSVTVFVPQIEATDLTICAGETTTLSVSGINSTATPSACPALPTNLQSGLVGYWPFCGNANDASGNGNNGVVTGASLSTDRSGAANSSYSFSTLNWAPGSQLNEIFIPYNPSFNASNISVFSWIKPLDYGWPGSGASIVRRFQGGYSNPNGQSWVLELDIANTGQVRSWVFAPSNNNNQNNVNYNGSIVPLNQWSYVGFTFDGTNLKTYLNGVLESTTVAPPGFLINSMGTSGISMGISNQANGFWFPYNGLLDDVTFHNRALSSFEVAQLFNQSLTTYLWSNGATTPTIDVSPTSTTTYTCTVTTNGVSCTDTVTVVVSNPVIDLGTDVTVCGTSTTLTSPSGYDSCLWSNGGTTNTTTVTANGTYTCTVTQGGCSATDSIEVTLIDATITASDTTICAGETVTLSVPQGGSTSTACAVLPTNLQTGLVGYWPFCGNANDASGNGNNGTVNGAALTTDRFGNANSAYTFDGVNDVISVPNSPTFSIFGPNQSSTITFWVKRNSTSDGDFLSKGLHTPGCNLGNKYLGLGWNSNTGVIYNLYNSNTMTSVQSGSSNNLISEWNHVAIVRNATTKMYINGVDISMNSINLGWWIDYNSSLATNLTFGARNNVSADCSTYFYNYFLNGLLDEIAIHNRALSASEIQQLYTLGQTTYLWSNGATTPTINVSPTSTTTYTCTVTTNGVSCADSVTVVVSQPVASITPNGIVEICQGQSIALTANGGVSYLWNTGAPTQSITVNTEAFYTVTVTDENGCTDTESQLVKVNFLPNIGVNNASICSGQSTTLTATGGLSYEWSPATGLSSTTGTTVTASPSTSTVYTVTGTGANGCTNTATAAVTINTLPSSTITPATATTFCQGGSVVLNANTGAGLSYQWFNNAVAISGETSSTYIANTSGSYTVIVTSTTTCSSTSNSIDVTTVANVNYFADADGDGFGDAASVISTCVQPQGYVTDNTDCNDNNANQNQASAEICNGLDDDCDGANDDGLVFDTYYADVDGDTYGDVNNSTSECFQPNGYVINNNDCNDNNANQNAASSEICNGEDDDCDGAIDNGLIFLDFYSDIDGDGFGAGDLISSCSDLGAGYVSNNTDCDDTNSGVYPGAEELCNSIDDNCDGQTDDGTLTVYFIDNDGDTYGNPSVSILACTQPIGYTPDDTDCNDTDANINPGAEDIGGNGIDENCDGQIDNSILELNSTIALYPNPTHSELNIQINSSIIGNDLHIFDAVGKIVYKQQLLSTQTTIPVSNFADGNYVVRVGEGVKRFVVEK